MTLDTDAVSAAIRDVAAQEILPKYKNLASHDIDTKSGDHDLVTAADKAAEQALIEALASLTPGYRFLGEEMAFDQDDPLSVLREDVPVWVLDPIDGTHNFVHHDPKFGVIVALVEARTIIGGWLHGPVDDVMIAGQRGQGVTCNGRPVNLGETASDPATLNLDGPALPPAAQIKIDSPSRSLRAASETFAQVVSSRSSCWAYMDLLRGNIDVTVSIPHHPWDNAAGTFLTNEAGGRASLLDGAAYDPAEPILPYGKTPAPDTPRLLAARTQDIWSVTRDHLIALL